MLKRLVSIDLLKRFLFALTIIFICISTVIAAPKKREHVNIKNDLYSINLMKGFSCVSDPKEINKIVDRGDYIINTNWFGQGPKKTYNDLNTIKIEFYTPKDKQKFEAELLKLFDNNKNLNIQNLEIGNKNVKYISCIWSLQEYDGAISEKWIHSFIFHEGVHIIQIDINVIKDISEYMDDFKYMISSFTVLFSSAGR
jgi:hypothetical protein